MRRLAAVAAVLAGLLVAPAVAPLAAAAKKGATKASSKKRTVKRRAARRVPARPKVSAAQKAIAQESVAQSVNVAINAGIRNAAALVPYYEMLYQTREGRGEPLRVLQFGDSHTASDDWGSAIRVKLQSAFGRGGPGFVHAGRPYAGFRRMDAKTSMSRGWEPAGLLNRDGDGIYGISGVSLSTRRAGETLTLEAAASRVEVFYLRQPGGGSFTVAMDGATLATVPTDGESGAGYYRSEVPSGTHSFTLTTAGNAPVRVFGWVAENAGGVTWETLGINGAQADLLLGWNDEILRSQLMRRDPALIVLAYGTNEARRSDWTYQSYKDAFTKVLEKLRADAPAASILVIGPPDQSIRVRRKWATHQGVDHILSAQMDAALENGCAFWDLRATMGGKGAMREWVQAGLAQGDFVHFTSLGYQVLGESLYELMMGQYGIFTAVRRQWIGTTANGPSSKDN